MSVRVYSNPSHSVILENQLLELTGFLHFSHFLEYFLLFSENQTFS